MILWHYPLLTNYTSTLQSWHLSLECTCESYQLCMLLVCCGITAQNLLMFCLKWSISIPTRFDLWNCCDLEQADKFVTYLSCDGPIVLHFKTIHCHAWGPIHTCSITMHQLSPVVLLNGDHWPVTFTTLMFWVSSSISLIKLIDAYPWFSTVTLPCACKGGQGSEKFGFI